MEKSLSYIITIVVCILFQLAIAPAIQIGAAAPNFLLIPVLAISMRSGAGAGGVAGFLLGLLYDFAGDGVVGAMALTFCVCALVVGLVSSAMETSPVISAGVAVIFAFVSELVYGTATVLSSSASGGAFTTMMNHAIPSGIYTAVICAFALVTMCFVVASDSPQMGGSLRGFGNRGGLL